MHQVWSSRLRWTRRLSFSQIRKLKKIHIVISKDMKYPTNSLYQEADICDSEQMFFSHIVSFQFKYKYGLSITRTQDKHTYKTRFSLKTTGQCSYVHLISSCYNQLPERIRKTQSMY